jgi:tetratricopeptide (TPR) repeat protein
MAALLTMGSHGALSWSVLRALKDRIRAAGAAILFITLPAALLLPALSVPWLILVTLAGSWVWGIHRRMTARWATRALGRGDSGRAERLYWLLWVTSLDHLQRCACRLSLAACAATRGDYELALRRLALVSDELEGALLAVSLNLHAYCLGREKRDLSEALSMSEQAIALRPQVAGFRHTRGLLLLELGRLEESVRDLEATWRESDGDDLLEAERCFDMGRLWKARGHNEYATDYFERAWRASPLSRWAEASRPHLLTTDAHEALEAQL